MNVLVALMPEACRTANSSPRPYGDYAMPAQAHLRPRQGAEEPMTEGAATPSPSSVTHWNEVQANNSTGNGESLLPVPATCYITQEACNNGTNSCSGHGQCYKKTGQNTGKPCFACFCTPTEDRFEQGDDKIPSYRIIYWGGAACQKKDVSGPFWLFAIFTVVLVGLVSWAIGMLFSIGEEKLPGVIGAGVSSKVR